MDILFITTQFPYPLDNGGKHGAINGLKVVSKDNNVTVLSFTEQPESVEEGIKKYKHLLPNVEFVVPVLQDIHIRKMPIKLMKVMLKDYITGIPYVTSKFDNKQMYQTIDKIFVNKYWDVVFVDYLNMFIYGDYIRKKYWGQYSVLVLKDHNIEYEIVKQAADNCSGIKKWILNREWKITKEYEEKAIQCADVVFSVCEENTSYMRTINEKSYTMLPTYIVNERKPEKNFNHNILYIGNLSWKANMEGVTWFVNRVFPMVKAKVTDAVLTIVGNGPQMNPFSEIKGVNYKGYIKDISHIYDNQSAFIVPLFEGSGIRIKILEAFDNEIAVVSTSLGCGTIGAIDGQEIIIADDEEAFASGVVSLLTDCERNQKITRNATMFLKESFSLEKRQEEFKAIIEGELQKSNE